MNALVAIVGRPNVGKSRLFNRMLSKRKSLVLDVAGTTRDTIRDTVEWGRAAFDVMDTGGLTDDKNTMHFRINKRVETVVSQAAAVLLVCDYRAGVVPYDLEIARWLRKTGKPVLVVVNKVDRPLDPSAVADFYQLGFKDVFTASAEHGFGVDAVLDAVTDRVKAVREDGGDAREAPGGAGPLRLAFVGRPNAGKSSMVNYILGNEIMIVDDRPGTTSDAVELNVRIKDMPVVLIDTAGLKKSRDMTALESLSVIKTKDALQRADVVVLVVDAAAGVTAYDKKIIGMIQRSGKGCVIALNKWDLVPARDRRRVIDAAAEWFGFADYVPIVPASAVSGEGVRDLTSGVLNVLHDYGYRVPTSTLNRFFRDTLREHQPVSTGGKIIKLYYLVQVTTRPPLFVIFTNVASGIRENYGKFIMNRLREAFGFRGVPVRVVFRSKGRDHD